MDKKIKVPLCNLRSYRLRWGLTVKELAKLVGVKSAPHMSRISNGKRNPTNEIALACQVLFGVSPSQMFPHVYTVVEDRVMWNICKFHSAREKSTSPSDSRKRELCERALKRVGGQSKSPKGA